MKRSRAIYSLQLLLLLSIVTFNGLSHTAQAQEAYTGNQTLKVGDTIEATYLGEWKKAVIVGPLQTNEFGNTYEIQFEGQNYSYGRISTQWVRPLSGRQPNKPEDKKIITPATSPKVTKPVTKPTNTFAVGDKILYRGGGPLWNKEAEIVSYDAQTRQYRLRFPSGSGDIVPCHSIAKPGPANNDFFIGNWAVFVSGATSTFVKGNDLYRRFSSGISLPPLEIKKDGTYTWRTLEGKTIKGQWKPREDVPGITLLKGIDGKDWTLYENTEGYATTEKTMDEIRFHHIPTSTGYYMAYRVGESKSCVLTGRTFKK